MDPQATAVISNKGERIERDKFAEITMSDGVDKIILSDGRTSFGQYKRFGVHADIPAHLRGRCAEISLLNGRVVWSHPERDAVLSSSRRFFGRP